MIDASEQERRATDSRLLMGIQRRERAAFESLYRSYAARLTRFLRRFTHRRDLIEEIINDCFMVIWLGAGEFRAASAVSSWIFGIAYRVAMKALRKRSNLIFVSDLSELPEPVIDATTQIDNEDWLQSALNSLPADQRTALLLAHRFGYSVAEISKIVASPEGTVKSRMFHGRSRLRSIEVLWSTPPRS